MRIRPVAAGRLADEIADRIASTHRDRRLRVAIDGASAARPDRFAETLVDPLRVRGREVCWVRSGDFLRPASLRLEHGRTNPDSFYLGWLDESGLRREVLDPAGPDGSGRVLPSLWNATTDRASRAGYRALSPTAVVMVSGPLLIGGVLPFDLCVHLDLSSAALARRIGDDERWTLPAYSRYAEEVAPTTLADIVIRMDDPQRPAVLETDNRGTVTGSGGD